MQDLSGFRILQSLDDISTLYHTTPAAIALAWLINRKSITAPIAIATSVEQSSELVPALTIEFKP